jgi:hypothetical protein
LDCGDEVSTESPLCVRKLYPCRKPPVTSDRQSGDCAGFARLHRRSPKTGVILRRSKGAEASWTAVTKCQRSHRFAFESLISVESPSAIRSPKRRLRRLRQAPSPQSKNWRHLAAFERRGSVLDVQVTFARHLEGRCGVQMPVIRLYPHATRTLSAR